MAAQSPNKGPASRARRAVRLDRAVRLRRTAVRRLVLGLILAWSAAALARETAFALAGWRGRHDYRHAPVLWRFGTPQTDMLARCLDTANAAVEPGSRLRLLAGNEDFFRSRWAAYLLPAHDLLPEYSRPEDADLVVALHARTLPGAVVMGGPPRCRLLRPPARPPTGEGR